MEYSIKKEVKLSFKEAIDKIKEELSEEGFGVLSEIDVQKTLKDKLDVNFENYIILGACNPPFAYKALLTEHEIGLLLPCNVIVYEKKGKVYVSAINPVVAMGFVDNKELSLIAEDIKLKLKRVIEKIN